jgi:hypothetical protein
VCAELYKLNVMETGGFFKPHKDTPRGGDTCFGTLVVALPVLFRGEEVKGGAKQAGAGGREGGTARMCQGGQKSR